MSNLDNVNLVEYTPSVQGARRYGRQRRQPFGAIAAAMFQGADMQFDTSFDELNSMEGRVVRITNRGRTSPSSCANDAIQIKRWRYRGLSLDYSPSWAAARR